MKRIILLLSILMCVTILSAQKRNGISYMTSKITHVFVDTEESMTSKMESEIRVGEGMIAFKNSLHNRAYIITDYDENIMESIWIFYVLDQDDKQAIIVLDLAKKSFDIIYKDIVITLFPITSYAEFKY